MNLRERAVWLFATRYAALYGSVKDATGRNLPGLGRTLRLLQAARPFTAKGFRFQFEPAIGTAFGRLIAGDWNEPETHAFLQTILPELGRGVHFVEVGSNIGEILMTALAQPAVADGLAFEADSRCAAATRLHLELNGFTNCRVIAQPVADGRRAAFRENEQFPVLSKLSMDDVESGAAPTARLDDFLQDIAPGDPVVVLIDAEGAELLVIQGMQASVARLKPLIIFEYDQFRENERAHRELDSMLAGYTLYRLRLDGRLDREMETSWNCVAIPAGTQLAEACASLIV